MKVVTMRDSVLRGLRSSMALLSNSHAYLALGLMACLVTSNAMAWGTDGHRVIALMAQSQLTPKARAEVERLLALEPGETLASVSTWADEHRNPTTGAWHYVNFPRDSCTYEAQRDCPDGKCVVGAINRQLDVLTSSAPDDKRLNALKYLVHFVGDVHQPLHAGYYDDKGGNKYQLQAFMRGSNLHALWDTGLIKNLNEEPQVLAARLLKTKSPSGISDFSPVRAAEESCRIVGSEGYYPSHKVGMDYIDKYTPLAEQRLSAAGQRLAGMLNNAFKNVAR